ICAELNVGAVATFASAGDMIDYSAKANFRALGKRFGQQTPTVAQAVASADAAALAAGLAANGRVTIEVQGIGDVELAEDDIMVTERPREGWAVLEDAGETVALDLALTPQLVAAGLARDVIRLVQDARKASGFDVSDRIVLQWSSDGTQPGDATAAAVRTHAGLIADEVLAVQMTEAAPLDPATFTDEPLGLRFSVTRA
ncbi:MAG: DUF5915 domain-containing protein, partial [Propionibacteriaceae bacterium]|nr:DUF5915 domain-containing protein [Propionibacteriaceae bacterium]